MVGEEEAVSPLPDLPMPTQEIPMLCLSMDSALGIPVVHLGSGREVRREEANHTRQYKRKRRETAPVSPRREAWKNSAAGANTKDFSDPEAKVPSACFFFFFLFNTAIRVTSLSKGQQLARVSRKLVWHGAGIIATFNE